MLAELDVHSKRLERGVDDFLHSTGPTAWIARHDRELEVRIDCLAIVTTARRLRRSAGHIAQEIPGTHLDEALRRFDSAVPDLVLFRDIAEHIDEYAIGSGRRDPQDTDAGEVFQLDIATDASVTITARERSLDVNGVVVACKALADCVQQTVNHHMIFKVMPGFADFEFFEDLDGVESAVPREDEDSRQREVRQMMSRMASTEPAPLACLSCGLAI